MKIDPFPSRIKADTSGIDPEEVDTRRAEAHPLQPWEDVKAGDDVIREQ